MAYAFVQQNANDNAASATTITVTLTPTAGNLLVFAISADSADTTSIALSDNLGTHNTFTQIGTDLVTAAAQRCAWWFAANCKGGATTFTATFSASARFRSIYVGEYSGIATTSPFLNGARAENNSPGTTTDAVSSGVANATSQPALVWGFCIDASGSTTPTAGTGYTSRTGVWSTATCLGRPEDKRVTATGNVAATFTATTGTDDHGTGVGIFAEAAPTSGAGSAAGTSTAAAFSPSNSGAGASAGTSTASAVGASIAAGTGSSAGTSTAISPASIFPLTVSSDGRYLKKNNGTPFLLCGDTTWSLFVDIPLASINSFLTTITGQGFNAVSGNVIEHHYTVVKPPAERGGILPFAKRLDGTTYTGSPNGTSTTNGTQGQFASDNYSSISTQAPDPTFPNNSYWVNCETILDACLQHNVAVLVWPGYLGFHADDEGWMNEMVAWDAVTGAGGFVGQSWADNTKSRMWNYGAWLANRWKAYPHIIWVMGGDYGSNTQTLSTSQAAAVSNLMAGLKSVAGQQSLLFSAHWDRPALSTDTTLAAGSFDLNGCYGDDSIAELARRGYAVSPAKPTIGLEYFYENDLFGGSAPYRKYMYWQYLGGIAGGLFGNEQIWRFDDGTPGTDWTTLLSTQATLDAQRQFTLWNTLPWHRLKPSGLGGLGAIVTAGGGTASPQSTDYVSAAATSEGDLLLAYVPPAHTGTVTVDMTKMSATSVARWFDPGNGSFTSIAALNNTGTHAFTTPGTNSAGDADFLLVLQTPTSTASGTSTAAATGQSLAAGAGTAAGSSTATATSSAIAASAGTSSGTSTAIASGAAAITGAGTSAGTSTASAVGVASVAGAGASTGTSTASAVGQAQANGAGTSAGISTASATGQVTAAATGTSTAASTAAAVGAALDMGTGTSAGVATATAAGQSLAAGTGSSAGAGTATATGAAQATTAGSSAGTSAASSVGAPLASGTGTAAGASTATGAGAGLSAGSGTGTAAGSSTATATGSALSAGVGTSAGASTATAVAVSNSGAGTSAGSSTATAGGAALVSGIAVSSGIATATAAGASLTAGTGSATGSSTATAVSAAFGSWMGFAAGSSTALGIGAPWSSAIGTAAGTSTAIAQSSGVAPGHVRITGTAPDPEVYDGPPFSGGFYGSS